MADEDDKQRPGLAIICNCLTPYRVHLHRAIAAGVPELKLHTLVTHGAADFDWKIEVPSEIYASYFGQANESPVAGLQHSPLSEWQKGGRLLEYMKRHDIRAAIIGLPRYLSYVRVLLEGRRAGRPIFVNSDANIQNERGLSRIKQLVKGRYHRWWVRRAFGVMPMGGDGEEYFLKYGADRQRMYRVPYWPNFEHFAAVDSTRLSEFRRLYGLAEGRRYFLYSGRLAPVKRVELLIEAFVKIAGDRPGWDLLIVGDGALRDGLKQRVPEELRSRVVWVGFLEESVLPSAYHAADVLVLPSDREPWAVVVQEALAAGLTVVASDVVGAARAMVKDGTDGRIFPAGDVDALASAMLDVSQPERLTSYKERAQVALQEWRRNNDPVTNVRRALVDAGVLAGATPAAEKPAVCGVI